MLLYITETTQEFKNNKDFEKATLKNVIIEEEIIKTQQTKSTFGLKVTHPVRIKSD